MLSASQAGQFDDDQAAAMVGREEGARCGAGGADVAGALGDGKRLVRVALYASEWLLVWVRGVGFARLRFLLSTKKCFRE